jgi:hypothetical protein
MWVASAAFVGIFSDGQHQVQYTGTQVTIPMLTEPTSTQRQAFHLVGVAIPLTLK